MARQLARRQRRERLGGIALALLGILVLVIALFALQHPRKNTTASATSAAHTSVASSSPPPHRTSAPAPTSSAPTSNASTSSAPARLPLLVLNNTTITGLAERAKQTFVAGGWTVTDTGNLKNEIVSTCAYYDPSVPGAQQAAEALQAQFPAIKRVVPRFAELPAGPIVVVLTPDYVSG